MNLPASSPNRVARRRPFVGAVGLWCLLVGLYSVPTALAQYHGNHATLVQLSLPGMHQ